MRVQVEARAGSVSSLYEADLVLRDNAILVRYQIDNPKLLKGMRRTGRYRFTLFGDDGRPVSRCDGLSLSSTDWEGCPALVTQRIGMIESEAGTVKVSVL